jgi:hypothetical protein
LISLLSLEFGSISSSPPVNVIVRMPRALRSGRSPAMTAPIALNVVDRGQHASGLIGATVSTYITVQVVRTDMTNYMEDYFAYGIFPGLRYLALLAAAVLIYPLPLIFGREKRDLAGALPFAWCGSCAGRSFRVFWSAVSLPPALGGL